MLPWIAELRYARLEGLYFKAMRESKQCFAGFKEMRINTGVSDSVGFETSLTPARQLRYPMILQLVAAEDIIVSVTFFHLILAPCSCTLNVAMS